LIISTDVTAVTVLVRHGMADLTTDFVFMIFVLRNIFGFVAVDLLVTVETFRPVFNFVSVAISIAVPVHFFGSVAFVALKIFFFMDIRRDSCVFPKVLFFYPAAMTGVADAKYRRSFLKKMTLKKSPFDGFRSTDMTLAATAVAATTVCCSGLSEFVQYGRLRPDPLFGHIFEDNETDVRAAGVMLCDIFMALTAGQ